MKTIVIKDIKTEFDRIKNAIANHGLIIFPTETVYGIGAAIDDERAVRQIFAVKGRPQDNPLIVHIAEFDQLKDLVTEIPASATKLMQKFWPGPLTLVFKKKPTVIDAITARLPTVAIRMPRHPQAQTLLKILKKPLCAPSANISGKPSGTTFDEVFKDFDGKVDIIVRGEPSDIGLESTVLDVTSSPVKLLRPGAITREHIENLLGEKIKATFSSDVPPSPGMKYTHYKPYGKVIILDGTKEKVAAYLKTIREKSVVFMGSNEYCEGLTVSTYSLGSMKNLDAIAKNLYPTLRRLDELRIETIYAQAFPLNGIGEALMNRLDKSSGHTVIKL